MRIDTKSWGIPVLETTTATVRYYRYNTKYNRHILAFLLFLFIYSAGTAQVKKTNLSAVGPGWAKTSVNATVFRTSSLVSHNGCQYIAYYNDRGHVVLAKRKLGTDKWTVKETSYKGNVQDAHNVITIMADGDGYLHMAWDHHGNTLHYCKSLRPESIEMGEPQPMIGKNEGNVTYTEFYRMPSGNLLFAYRDGSSGNGNLVLNRYDTKAAKWTRLHSNLIDGQGERNAYWQIHLSRTGAIHISWVWRESPDVAANHDMCYAVSHDEAKTWQTSAGKKYTLPITMETAEYAARIPQRSDLINQTSMTAGEKDTPYIATYYQAADDASPQYYIIYKKGAQWATARVSARTTDFDLAGGGSRSIPISRPQLLHKDGPKEQLAMIFRDDELGGGASLTLVDIPAMTWKTTTLTKPSLERWEPSYDPELWRSKQQLHIFLQKVGQESGERAVQMDPQMVNVLEVTLR